MRHSMRAWAATSTSLPTLAALQRAPVCRWPAAAARRSLLADARPSHRRFAAATPEAYDAYGALLAKHHTRTAGDASSDQLFEGMGRMPSVHPFFMEPAAQRVMRSRYISEMLLFDGLHNVRCSVPPRRWAPLPRPHMRVWCVPAVRPWRLPVRVGHRGVCGALPSAAAVVAAAGPSRRAALRVRRLHRWPPQQGGAVDAGGGGAPAGQLYSCCPVRSAVHTGGLRRPWPPAEVACAR